MARAGGQKIKLLYLKEILERETDEAHPMSVQQLIAALAQRGVAAERKALYDDIEALQQYGMDIVVLKGRQNQYYLGERDFQLPELKLLVDAAQSAKFITEKKSRDLIRKISALASRHDQALLARQVFVQGRVKTMNESIYYNMDLLQTAMAEGVQLRCRYYEWAVDPAHAKHWARRWKKGGKPYLLSPWAMLWDAENYYLLAYDGEAGRLKHYRVDKLAEITLLPARREGREAFERLDMGAYTRRHFGMYGGEETVVKLRFANHLIGVVVDRFGKEVSVQPDGPGHFTVSTRLVVSPQFYGWLLGFGDEAQLLAPESAVNGLRDTLRRVGGLYAATGRYSSHIDKPAQKP